MESRDFYNKRISEDSTIGSIKLMQEYSDQQSKTLLEEIERLKGEKDELIKSHECGIFCNTK